MSNSYYNHGTYPIQGSFLQSAGARSEFDNVTAGFALLPTLSGNGGALVAINAGGTAQTAITAGTSGQVLKGTGALSVPTFQDNVLNGIAAAAAANSINNADFAQTWNWALTTAAKSAFKITENTAATGGSGAQYLLDVQTIASSTAIPFRVKSLGLTDAILVDQTGGVTITGVGSATTPGVITITGGAPTTAATAGAAVSLTGGLGNTSGTGGAASLVGGRGGTSGAGGAITLTSGAGGSTSGASGAVTLASGTTTSGATGNITISSGNATAGASGTLTISTGTSSSTTAGAITISTPSTAVGSANTADINITTGSASGAGGPSGGNIVLTAGTGNGAGTNGTVNFVNCNVANAAVGCVFTASVGPTGANTAIQGWMKFKVGGVFHYFPYW